MEDKKDNSALLIIAALLIGGYLIYSNYVKKISVTNNSVSANTPTTSITPTLTPTITTSNTPTPTQIPTPTSTTSNNTINLFYSTVSSLTDGGSYYGVMKQTYNDGFLTWQLPVQGTFQASTNSLIQNIVNDNSIIPNYNVLNKAANNNVQILSPFSEGSIQGYTVSIPLDYIKYLNTQIGNKTVYGSM
jgi:hypothetical protein